MQLNAWLPQLNTRTYYIAFLHVAESRELSAAATLSTRDENQKAFTASTSVDGGFPFASLLYENCNVVAVTRQPKVH
jgi:hypothetical protein